MARALMGEVWWPMRCGELMLGGDRECWDWTDWGGERTGDMLYPAMELGMLCCLMCGPCCCCCWLV